MPHEYTMDLLLWRHAEAEDDHHDLRRRLSERGRQQATAVARWLLAHCPENLRILVSPAMRTQQTAEALGLPFAIDRRLGPDASVANLITASGWPTMGGTVLIVGHQPALGRLAAKLLSGQEANWAVKKGALWWFSGRTAPANQTQTVLRAVISDALL